MILVHPCASFLFKKLFVSARKLRRSQDVQLPIAKAILHKFCDALIFTVSNVYKQTLQSLVFISFLRIFRNTRNYIFEKKSIPKFIGINQVSFDKHKLCMKILL